MADRGSSAPEAADVVVVGRVAGAYGVDGAVRVVSATQPRENLARYRPWLLLLDGSFRAVDVQSLRPHGDGFVARLAGVGDRDAAGCLAGTPIAVPRAALPALEGDREYYWRDLIGLRVVDQHGTLVGVVESLLETGAHDVLVIQDGARQTLIPFADPFLLDVDVAGGCIRVDWQEPV